MNLLDMVIVSAMIFLIVKGIFRGFLREIASLIGIVLGIWMANRFQPEMTAYLKGYLPPTEYLPLIAFGSIFAFVLLLSNIIGWLLKMVVKKVFLGWVDRILGAGLAFAKGVIVIYLVMVLFTFFLPTKSPLIARSKLAPFIISSYQGMARLISPEFYKKWKKRFTERRGQMEVFPSGMIMGEKNEDGQR
jgi:membrane protein required for colicin V production